MESGDKRVLCALRADEVAGIGARGQTTPATYACTSTSRQPALPTSASRSGSPPDGTPVSMAGSTSMVGGMIRVDPVYTPAHLRGRGYGRAATVEVCRAAPPRARRTSCSSRTLPTPPATPSTGASDTSRSPTSPCTTSPVPSGNSVRNGGRLYLSGATAALSGTTAMASTSTRYSGCAKACTPIQEEGGGFSDPNVSTRTRPMRSASGPDSKPGR